MKTTAAGEWTAARVERELPALRVMVRGKVYPARIVGTRLPFPRARIQNAAGEYESIEFSWETFASSLNAGTPLIG